jgi:hypothetical protein
MSRRAIAILITVAFVAGAAVVVGNAQTGAAPEGAKPYVPSRLEWLATDMQSRFGQRLSLTHEYLMDFIGVEAENTLLIYVRCLPTANRAIMNEDIEAAKQAIAIQNRKRGWAKWIRVREDIKRRT